MIDLNTLRGIVPDDVRAELPVVMHRYKINTRHRLAHFLSQCAHESAGFTRKTENLNYSKAGLLAVFPRHFTPEQAQQYARKPKAIANRVYANRMGNGPEESGDGWRHRGQGFIQLTGKNNQQAFFDSINLPADGDPAIIADMYPLESAAWFWTTNNLNALADTGTVECVTRKVNGGLNGIDDRRRRFFEVFKVLRYDTGLAVMRGEKGGLIS